MEPYQQVELPPIPHPNKPAGRTTWHKSGEFFGQYDNQGRDPRTDPAYADLVRRHYAACVTYADKHVGDLLNKLDEAGQAENTIVVLWGDHGWHLGEHAIWGKHCLFEEALRSPLIIAAPRMQQPGEPTHSVVETAGLFPTLCELAGLPMPGFCAGVSLAQQLADPSAPGHAAYAYTGNAKTLRTDTHRITLHSDGFVELYDHRSEGGETKNVARQHLELVENLKVFLSEKDAEW